MHGSKTFLSTFRNSNDADSCNLQDLISTDGRWILEKVAALFGPDLAEKVMNVHLLTSGTDHIELSKQMSGKSLASLAYSSLTT